MSSEKWRPSCPASMYLENNWLLYDIEMSYVWPFWVENDVQPSDLSLIF